MASTRNILIVEDDRDVSSFYQLYCRNASKLLSENGLNVVLNINTAFSYEEAINVLEKEQIDFLSIDLALKEEEKGLTDSKRRNEGKEASGMRILQYLHEAQQYPSVIVMSGEKNLSYATEALQKYNVFAYFQKLKDESNYSTAVEALLWFLEANTLLSNVESDADYDSMNLIEIYLQNAKIRAENASIGSNNFPFDLDSRISLVKSKLDAATKLPGNEWTESKLRKRILGEGNWALIKLQISNYELFASDQASQVDPLLGYIGRIAKDKCHELGLLDSYVGLWRYENPYGPSVLVVFNQYISLLSTIAENITNEVQEKAKFFLHSFDGLSTWPEVKFQTWDNKNNSDSFTDWHQIVDSLGKPIK